MLVLPAPGNQADGIPLPDVELYDELHALQLALERHDRPAAAALHERMHQRAEHRLTLYGQRVLAGYDDDPTTARRVYDQLLAKFPDDTILLLAKIGALHAEGTRQQRLDFLTEACDKPDSHPLFKLQLAEELMADARMHAEAGWLLRRFLRRRPIDARAFHAQGHIGWEAGKFTEAAALYRAAACLDDKNENFAPVVVPRRAACQADRGGAGIPPRAVPAVRQKHESPGGGLVQRPLRAVAIGRRRSRCSTRRSSCGRTTANCWRLPPTPMAGAGKHGIARKLLAQAEGRSRRSNCAAQRTDNARQPGRRFAIGQTALGGGDGARRKPPTRKGNGFN